jgi:hypothetical protein
MPTLSASDYTTFVKLKAANAAYQNGNIPKQIQRTYQPYPTISIMNAQLFASQASLALNPGLTTLSRTAYGRVRPWRGYGNVNNPRKLSTVTTLTGGPGINGMVAGSVNLGTKAPPPGRVSVE